jgi:hypothetical protein
MPLVRDNRVLKRVQVVVAEVAARYFLRVPLIALRAVAAREEEEVVQVTRVVRAIQAVRQILLLQIALQ